MQKEGSDAVPVTVLPGELEEAIRRDQFGGVILLAPEMDEAYQFTDKILYAKEID